MSVSLRLGLVPDLDRTVALRTGEVGIHGTSLEVETLSSATNVLASRFGRGDLDLAQVDIAEAIAEQRSAGEPSWVAVPVFLTRYRPSDLLHVRKDSTSGGEAVVRSGVDSSDAAVTAWAPYILSRLIPPLNSPEPQAAQRDDLVQALVTGGLDAIVTRPPVRDTAVRRSAGPVRPSGQTLVPLMDVVVIRRDLYIANRWLAVETVEAFAAAKRLGWERLRYFGALAVGLPFLHELVEAAEATATHDSAPYGVASNRNELEYLMGRTGASVDDFFARETLDHPGVEDRTAYAVPLSRPQHRPQGRDDVTT